MSLQSCMAESASIRRWRSRASTSSRTTLRFIALGECRASSEWPEPLRKPQLAASVSIRTERGEEDKAASGGGDLWEDDMSVVGEVRCKVTSIRIKKQFLMILIPLETNMYMPLTTICTLSSKQSSDTVTRKQIIIITAKV